MNDYASPRSRLLFTRRARTPREIPWYQLAAGAVIVATITHAAAIAFGVWIEQQRQAVYAARGFSARPGFDCAALQKQCQAFQLQERKATK